MTSTTILQIFLTIFPSAIVGLVAYYFFGNYMNNEEKRRRHELKQKSLKEMLPHRIQALERMTLYLERIDPGRLLTRVQPTKENKDEYERLLIHTIEQEFEHNLTQQIYLGAKSWEVIKASKNATISLIRKMNMSDQVDSAQKLQEVILTELLNKSSPSSTGLAYLRKEAHSLW